PQQRLVFSYSDSDEPVEPGESGGSDEADPFDDDRVVTLKVARSLKDVGVDFNVLSMSLSDDAYSLACDAHKMKWAIRVKGKVVRRGKRWILDPCEHFERAVG